MSWLLTLLLWASPAETAPQECAVGGTGRLRLRVPREWKLKCTSAASPPRATVKLAPATGKAFTFEITAVWLPRQKRLSPEAVDQLARKAAEKALRGTRQRPGLWSLGIAAPQGSYFEVHDPSPPPGAWEHLMQAVAMVDGELELLATWLSHDADDAAALAVLQSASYVK